VLYSKGAWPIDHLLEGASNQSAVAWAGKKGTSTAPPKARADRETCNEPRIIKTVTGYCRKQTGAFLCGRQRNSLSANLTLTLPARPVASQTSGPSGQTGAHPLMAGFLTASHRTTVWSPAPGKPHSPPASALCGLITTLNGRGGLGVFRPFVTKPVCHKRWGERDCPFICSAPGCRLVYATP
jgi:hypothetical protein